MHHETDLPVSLGGPLRGEARSAIGLVREGYKECDVEGDWMGMEEWVAWKYWLD